MPAGVDTTSLVAFDLDSAHHSSGDDPGVAEVVLEFDPVRDGFSFPNVFAWTQEDLGVFSEELKPLLDTVAIVAPGLAGQLLKGKRGLVPGLAVGTLLASTGLLRRLAIATAKRWPTFGLCGGMALLAKERWERRDASTAKPTSALLRDEVRPLLRHRQAQTIRAAWFRFLRFWLRARTTKGVFDSELLRHEFEKASEEIRGNRPALLGLVGDAPDPFSLHQVLAFGFRTRPGLLELMVYDPNEPGRARSIRLLDSDGASFLETDISTGPRRAGGYHISRRAGVLSMLFVIDD